MFPILKKKSTAFFAESKDWKQIFEKASSAKEQRRFFSYLIAHQLQEPQKIVDFCSELKKEENFPSGELLSVLWSISLDLSRNPTEHPKLSKIVSLLAESSLVEKGSMLENLTDLLISQSGMMEQQQLDRKTTRAYTKVNYEQHKHSLIKESNEGFSKLLLFLTNLDNSLEAEKAWQKIIALVGNFDLDPDRVLALVIEAKIMNPDTKLYEHFIQKFKRDSIATILGNKLSQNSEAKSKSIVFAGYPEDFMKATMEQIHKKDPEVPNPTLVSVVCGLIKRNVIQFSDIQNFLSPTDSEMESLNYKRIKLGQEKVMKSFKISLQELDRQQKVEKFHEDNQKFMGQLLYSSKLAIISEFLRTNEWPKFAQLWAKYKDRFDLLLYQPILNNLLSLAEWMIEPLYSKVSYARFCRNHHSRSQKKYNFANENGLKQIEELNEENFGMLLELMSYFKDYIGFKHSLFVKICRIFKSSLKEKLTTSLSKQSLSAKVKLCLQKYLIPGVGYETHNPTLSIEAFQLLELFPYQFRYQCYLEVYQRSMTQNPYMAKWFETVKNKQNVIVNNLSKDNKKQFLKKLAKLTHNHALQVMYWIVRRLLKEDYEAVVPEIIGALNNSTNMTLEMTMFLMVFYMNENKEPAVKIKTAEMQSWFKNIITFVSLFYRKYLDVDMRPIFDFVISRTSQEIRQLEDEEEMPSAYIKLLDEVLKKMLGSFIEEDINKTKYEILCTGPRLQFELRYLTSEIRAAKKSKHTLQEFFWGKTAEHEDGNSMAFNLIVLLSQKRAEFVHKTLIENIKIIGDTYDAITVLIVQLMKVLAYQATDENKYRELLPSSNPLDVLINQYKVPLEIAFEMVRPGVKFISKMTVEEFESLKGTVQTAFNDFIQNKNYAYHGYADEQIKQHFLESKQLLHQSMPIGFFTCFWFLTLDSVYFPAELYAEKILDLGKKLDSNGKRLNDREYDKNKALYEKIQKEEEIQKEKRDLSLKEQNLKRLEISFLKNSSEAHMLMPFAQNFVKLCLLPRLLLDPGEALYCMKFIILIIKANKMSSSKSIRLLTFIIEFVMNYLPLATKRQASNCLSTFLSEILGVFINWNDPIKLKQDMKKYLDIEDLKDNYQKLKEYLLKVFERVGNLIKSIKEEPYIIKNCLYLLEKVDAIPGHKEQAEDLEGHVKELREIYTTSDMKTILDMQIILLNMKKEKLSERPQTKGSVTIPNQTIRSEGDQSQSLKNKSMVDERTQNVEKGQKADKVEKAEKVEKTMPAVYAMLSEGIQNNRRDLSRDREHQRFSKDRNEGKYSRDRNSENREKEKSHYESRHSKERNKQRQRHSNDREKERKDKTDHRSRIKENNQEQMGAGKKDYEKERERSSRKGDSHVRQTHKNQKKLSSDRIAESKNREKSVQKQANKIDFQQNRQDSSKAIKEQLPLIKKRTIKGQQIQQPSNTDNKSSVKPITAEGKRQKQPKISVSIQVQEPQAIPPVRSLKAIRDEHNSKKSQLGKGASVNTGTLGQYDRNSLASHQQITQQNGGSHRQSPVEGAIQTKQPEPQQPAAESKARNSKLELQKLKGSILRKKMEAEKLDASFKGPRADTPTGNQSNLLAQHLPKGQPSGRVDLEQGQFEESYSRDRKEGQQKQQVKRISQKQINRAFRQASQVKGFSVGRQVTEQFTAQVQGKISPQSGGQAPFELNRLQQAGQGSGKIRESKRLNETQLKQVSLINQEAFGSKVGVKQSEELRVQRKVQSVGKQFQGQRGKIQSSEQEGELSGPGPKREWRQESGIQRGQVQRQK